MLEQKQTNKKKTKTFISVIIVHPLVLFISLNTQRMCNKNYKICQEIQCAPKRPIWADNACAALKPQPVLSP